MKRREVSATLDEHMRHHRFAFAIGVLALLLGTVLVADEGWVIERFESRIEIRPDGALAVREAIDVDFRGLSRHGIFRELVQRLQFDAVSDRQYPITLDSVTSEDGRRHPVEASNEGPLRRFRIGDPDRTIDRRETYRLSYAVEQTLNSFPSHDELYWNAIGVWPVAIDRATILVAAPAGVIERVACFQGPTGSTERCDARIEPGASEARFTATRRLTEGEQVTVVAALRKGAIVPEPLPRLVPRPRDITRFFDRSPGILALAMLTLVTIVGGVGTIGWRFGRDRRYQSLMGTAPEGSAGRDERVPLFGARPVAVEFEPPDQLRPAQMGLLVDERADTLDVTATIVDLAVRGYLKITEVPGGWFRRTDWQLDRLKAPDASLLTYERVVLNGLFTGGSSCTLSSLKNRFHDDLAKAQDSLYADAVARGWFPRNPHAVRSAWRVVGLLVVVAGVTLVVLLGQRWGAGLVALPVVVGGLLLTIVAAAMPRRTASGRRLMKRTLGFVRYVRTAETGQQAFAERANIFTTYLPYAIVFKCVEKWAGAFADIDMQAATAGWYSGPSRFQPSRFSSSLGSFSTSVSRTIASTPGGSGGSGFSGGSSGGGGGGGGGGSW
jgi:uncharacterized protein (TIGR04222 family)